MKISSKGKYSKGYEINIDEDNGAITLLYDNKDFPKFNIINNSKIFGSVCYTLKTDEITKGEKPPLTPFIDRQALFDSYIIEKNTLILSDSSLKIKLKYIFLQDEIEIECESDNDKLSEFGLNLPFNFMGEKGHDYIGQVLPSTPYTSYNGEYMYWLLTRPNKNAVLITCKSKCDGWKLDYSPYSCGHFITNLKILSEFDKAYKENSDRKHSFKITIQFPNLIRNLFKLLSENYNKPVAYYRVSSCKIGNALPILLEGKCDSVEVISQLGKKTFYQLNENSTTINIIPSEYGIHTVIPYINGEPGLDCKIFAYDNYLDMFDRNCDKIKSPYHNDENLCEGGIWAWALMLNSKLRGNKNKYDDVLNEQINKILGSSNDSCIQRCTILKEPHENYPAYHIMKSTRIQEQFTGVSILLQAYELYNNEVYYEFAVATMMALVKYYITSEGMVKRPKSNDLYEFEDYTTVTAMVIPLVDLTNLLKSKHDIRFKIFEKYAVKIADFLVDRDLDFPTEGIVESITEKEMEEGSISCTALSVLYVCYYVKHKNEYVDFAKKILDLHDAWTMHTPDARLYRSTLRWWETIWEGDADGPAICGGHAWTIWRGEAEFYYALLTCNTERLIDSYNAYMTNLSKIQQNGDSYACYQPDYITGGNFTKNCEDIDFRIVRGFPKKNDYSLSRFVWVRMRDTWLKITAVINYDGFNGVINGDLIDCKGILELNSHLEHFSYLYIDGIKGKISIKSNNGITIITKNKVIIEEKYIPICEGETWFVTPQEGKIDIEVL